MMKFLKYKKGKENNLDVEPVFASQIKKLRKRFCQVDQPLCRSGLTLTSCTKLKIHSAHAKNPVSKQISYSGLYLKRRYFYGWI